MPQRDQPLFVSERPVRSDYARERVYARRRMMTVTVLLLIVAGAGYEIWKHQAHSPADIPTIKADANYKQKPVDPGGIDIPHQDVELYDQLEGKNTPQQQVEHLLPPPEAPQDVPHAAALMPAPQPTSSAPQPPAPQPAPQASAPAPAPTPVVAAAAPAATTPPPAAPAPPQTIADVLKDTMASTASEPASSVPAPASGTVAVQLASTPDQAAAQIMMQNLQQKYAADLKGATLHLVKADLGSRGIFYRIQSQMLGQDAANQICSSLKQKNAGCILVRK